MFSHYFSRFCFGALLISVTGSSVVVAAESFDKFQYNLFNPTAVSAMRELSTDRPDQTESPFTVDAGHIQLEIDFANATFDQMKSDGITVKNQSILYGNSNIKIGLSNSVDVQFMVSPIVSNRTEVTETSSVTDARGFGEVTTRVKINVWGNDGGESAFAVMPYVKWPLSISSIRNGQTEGGIIFPYGANLTPEWGLGAMAQVDFVHNGENLETQYFATGTVSSDLSEQLGAYFELAARFLPTSPWEVQFDTGLTYAVSDNYQWDIGTNIGLTAAAPDFTVFTGVSLRY